MSQPLSERPNGEPCLAAVGSSVTSMASALLPPEAPEGGLILKEPTGEREAAEGRRETSDGGGGGWGAKCRCRLTGRCVPRSRYLLRSVERRASGLFGLKLVPTYLPTPRRTLCEMRLEHILPRLLHPVFHINGRFSHRRRTSPSPSSYLVPPAISPPAAAVASASTYPTNLHLPTYCILPRLLPPARRANRGKGLRPVSDRGSSRF